MQVPYQTDTKCAKINWRSVILFVAVNYNPVQNKR